MTIQLKPATTTTWTDEDIFARWSDSADTAVEDEGLKSVQAISAALDRVRVICSDLGITTLLAEVRGVPSEIVVATLDDLATAGERALASLRAAARS